MVEANFSFGSEGAIGLDLKAKLYNQPARPVVVDFIAGLGGREVNKHSVTRMVKRARELADGPGAPGGGVDRPEPGPPARRAGPAPGPGKALHPETGGGLMDAAIKFEHDELFVSGHRGCPGCGLALAVRHILKATGPDIIVVSPTGCLETISSPFGFSPWGAPWIHHLFENGPSVASGVIASLKAKGQTKTRVIVIGGDGGTF